MVDDVRDDGELVGERTGLEKDDPSGLDVAPEGAARAGLAAGRGGVLGRGGGFGGGHGG